MYTYDRNIDWRYEYFDYVSKCRVNPPCNFEYSEKHQIINKCLTEDDTQYNHPDNTINLRFSERVTAHLLLSFMLRQFYDLGNIDCFQFKKMIDLYFTPVYLINRALDGHRNAERSIADITDDILKSCDDFKERNLTQILEIAKRHEPRPPCTSDIGMALHSYVNPKNFYHRHGLKEKILDILPVEVAEQWFRDVRKENNMNLLRKMARNGEKRPVCRIMGNYNKTDVYLGRVLHLYTTAGNECYVPGFREELIALNLTWFREERVADNMHRLLEMARNGLKRPTHKEELGMILSNYTTETSTSYQVGFKELLLDIRPDWFLNERAQYNMDILRGMANRREKRPSQKTRLGKYLSRYLDPTSRSFRNGFREELIVLLGDAAGDWFLRNHSSLDARADLDDNR